MNLTSIIKEELGFSVCTYRRRMRIKVVRHLTVEMEGNFLLRYLGSITPAAIPRHSSYKQSKSCLPLNKDMSISGTFVGIGTKFTKAFKFSFKDLMALPMGPLGPA